MSEQSPREPGSACEESVALRLGRGAHRLLEQLARHAERKLPLEHRATRLEHLEARVPGKHPGAPHQPALADPRRRLDQKGASGALARPRDGFPEGLQLALALEQIRDRGRLGPHRRGRHPGKGEPTGPGSMLKLASSQGSDSAVHKFVTPGRAGTGRLPANGSRTTREFAGVRRS